MNGLIGVISDTHGMLREEVIEKLRPCALIIHAGDIGDQSVLDELRKISKVVAVRGNVDTEPWSSALKKDECVSFNGKHIYVIHNIDRLDIDPKAAGLDAVICGHSHKPSIEYKDTVLYLNPGSAGPKRFELPVSMAYLRLANGTLTPEIVVEFGE